MADTRWQHWDVESEFLNLSFLISHLRKLLIHKKKYIGIQRNSIMFQESY